MYKLKLKTSAHLAQKSANQPFVKALHEFPDMATLYSTTVNRIKFTFHKDPVNKLSIRQFSFTKIKINQV